MAAETGSHSGLLGKVLLAHLSQIESVFPHGHIVYHIRVDL